MDEFSRAFEKGFLDTLSHRHGTKRVLANRVYQEYIGDKHHVHMNSTRWTSLTGLCKHLGKEGKAVVDETEKGWFIQYIDRDPKALARQLQNEERRQSELDEEERSRRMILAQIRAANELKEASGAQEEDEDGDGGAEGKGEKEGEGEGKALYAPVEVSLKIAEPKKRKLISFQLSDEPVSKSKNIENKEASGQTANCACPQICRSAFKFRIGEFCVLFCVSSYFHCIHLSPLRCCCPDYVPPHPPPHPGAHVGSGPSLGTSSTSSSSGPARSQLEQLMLDEEARKAAQLAADDKRDRRDHWLHPGLVVKVVNKKLADGKYYKKKGVVLGVHDVYVGDVEVEGAVVRLDQEHLETVIPKVRGRWGGGGWVRG